MKKLGVLIWICIGIYSCKNSAEFNLTASVDGIEDGKKVFVRKLGAQDQFVVVDTLEIKKGKFTYKGSGKIPELYYFFIENARGSIPVIIERGKIKIMAYKDSLNASVIDGTSSNKDLQELMTDFKNITKKSNAMRMKMMKANSDKDSVAAKQLQTEFEAFQKENIDYQKNFINAHPQSYVSILVLKQLLLTNGIETTEAERMYKTFPKHIKATKEAKEIGEKLQILAKIAVGAVAPNFSGPTPTGSTLSLKEVKGKVTIIDFWAAWCKPCRVENPNLVALYNKYHDKGLHVIGVSLDRKAEDWKKAIAEDHLPWHQISHLKFWQDPIAQQYNVRAIPATFILDKDGKIAAKDLSGAALEAKVVELLK